MLKKYRLIIVITLLLAFSILSGFSLKGKNITYNKNNLLNNDYAIDTSLVSAITEYSLNKENYINLFINDEILIVNPLEKNIYGDTIVTTLNIEKVIRSKELSIGNIIKVIEPYSVIQYMDNSIVESTDGLNMPLTGSNKYIINVKKLYGNLYKYKTTSYSSFIFDSNNTIQTYEINDSVLNIDATVKYSNIAFYINPAIYTAVDGEMLFNIKDIDKLISEMNQIQTDVLTKINNLINSH